MHDMNPFSSNISIEQDIDNISKGQSDTQAIPIEPTKNEELVSIPLKLKKVEIKAPKVAESWNEKRSYRGTAIIRTESAKCKSKRNSIWQKNDYIQAGS